MEQVCRKDAEPEITLDSGEASIYVLASFDRQRLEFASDVFTKLGFSGKSLACRAALWVGYQSTGKLKWIYTL